MSNIDSILRESMGLMVPIYRFRGSKWLKIVQNRSKIAKRRSQIAQSRDAGLLMINISILRELVAKTYSNILVHT
jgi:hypothetical protein